MSINQINSSPTAPTIPIGTTTVVPNSPIYGYITYNPTYTYSYEWSLPSLDDGPVIVEEKKINKEGCTCTKCKEHYPWAQANQEDNTLICWGCRNRY